MKIFLCLVVTLVVLCVAHGAVIADFEDGQYRLDTAYLETLECPLAIVVAVGDSRVGKSTTKNALSKLHGQDASFYTHNRLQQCTTAVQVAPLLPGCILLVDRPGQNKAGVAKGVDPTKVDIMTTQLLAPVANTVVAFVDSVIMENDLQGLAMFGDEHLHLGKQGSTEFKPDLIIVLKRSKPMYLHDDNKPCTEQEYLDYEVPADSPLRKAFASISLIIMPDVPIPDMDYLSYDNFQPERIPEYWAAINRLSAMISASAARVPASARLTGSDLSVALQQILPSVNANVDIDPVTTRTAVLLNKLKISVQAQKAGIQEFFAPFIADPFHADHHSAFLPALTSRRALAEKAVLDMFRVHEGEADLWRQMLSLVKAELDPIFSAVTHAYEKKKGEISAREQKALEEARVAMSTARTSLQLNGNPVLVNHDLTSALRGAIQSFQTAAVIDKVTPSPSYVEKLQRLKDDAGTQWSSAHDANYAAHTTKRQELLATRIAEVAARIDHDESTPSNTHRSRHFELASRLPQYFAPGVRAHLYSVRSSLHGSGDGAGYFTLTPGIGETLVSAEGIVGRRYNGNRVYYNPDNAVLRVYLEGYGWDGGVRTNPLWMKHVDLTITRNALALPENAVYNRPYVRGEAPVF